MFPLFFDDLISPDFLSLIESDHPDFVVLAEVQPMEVLSAWVPEGGGFTNTYFWTFPSQIATTIVPGGIYRRLDFVRQNATMLTARASVALVDANLGSYFLDQATGFLHVSTTTGAHPNTFALVGAWFTLFFASTSISFSDQPLYAPLVVGDLPTLTSEMPDSLFGATVSDSGSLSLLNGDGLFDRLSRQYIWRNKRATFKLGGGSLAYSDFATFDTLRINSPDVDDEVAVLKLEDIGSILNKSLPLRTWGDGTIGGGLPPDVPAAGINGLSQPLIFGTVENCPCALGGRNTGVSDLWYAFDANLGAYGTCSVDLVYAIERATQISTLLIPITDYISPAVGGVIVITNSTYFYETHDILATITNTAFATNSQFGEMALAILRICGESDANIDLTAFAAANTAAPQILARYVGSPIIAADLMRELEQSVNGQVYKGRDGRWTCRLLTPDIPASLPELADVDFVTWEPEDDENLVSVLNEVRVRWGHQPLADNWFEASSSDDTTRYANETTDTHRLDTWLTTAADASTLAHHLRFFRSIPAMLTRAEQRGLGLMTNGVGDLVSVTRDRAPLARTGRYDGHLLRIVKITKALGPDVPTVDITLTDLDGQTDRIFRLAGSGSTITWSTATAQEKARYGFLGDTFRLIDPADALTRDAKALW